MGNVDEGCAYRVRSFLVVVSGRRVSMVRRYLPKTVGSLQSVALVDDGYIESREAH